jgi:alkanesulfonate monooxygenase SsuD/methylene tetrahydromethanopterin reductase-like flavin-dependent oxidoreductase (luciferase family)
MLKLVAKYADAWNWWVWDEAFDDAAARLRPLIKQVDAACETEEREPASLERTLDLYTVVAPDFEPDPSLDNPIHGSAEDVAGAIASFGDLGFDEVRCDVHPKNVAAIEAMTPVIDLLHQT